MSNRNRTRAVLGHSAKELAMRLSAGSTRGSDRPAIHFIENAYAVMSCATTSISWAKCPDEVRRNVSSQAGPRNDSSTEPVMFIPFWVSDKHCVVDALQGDAYFLTVSAEAGARRNQC